MIDEEGSKLRNKINFIHSKFIEHEISLKLQQTDQSPFISTSFEKPSFNLFFREDYNKTELDYPILGQDYPVKSFDQIRARAGKNDIVNPFIKDELILNCRGASRATALPADRSARTLRNENNCDVGAAA